MAERPKNVGDVLKMMKDKEVKFLDLRFTDTKGKMQHVTADGSCVNEAMFAEGYAFDGSSIAGRHQKPAPARFRRRLLQKSVAAGLSSPPRKAFHARNSPPNA